MTNRQVLCVVWGAHALIGVHPDGPERFRVPELRSRSPNQGKPKKLAKASHKMPLDYCLRAYLVLASGCRVPRSSMLDCTTLPLQRHETFACSHLTRIVNAAVPPEDRIGRLGAR